MFEKKNKCPKIVFHSNYNFQLIRAITITSDELMYQVVHS